jgi:hypothetical protein
VVSLVLRVGVQFPRYPRFVKPGQHGPGIPPGFFGILQHAPDRGADRGYMEVQKERSISRVQRVLHRRLQGPS